MACVGAERTVEQRGWSYRWGVGNTLLGEWVLLRAFNYETPLPYSSLSQGE